MRFWDLYALSQLFALSSSAPSRRFRSPCAIPALSFLLRHPGAFVSSVILRYPSARTLNLKSTIPVLTPNPCARTMKPSLPARPFQTSRLPWGGWEYVYVCMYVCMYVCILNVCSAMLCYVMLCYVMYVDMQVGRYVCYFYT